ncbi:MAG: hypothetical protein PHN19_06045 [Patescibacteria group bacterium]|nr:hypothetical protein [Patescibacteria group bacterium]
MIKKALIFTIASLALLFSINFAKAETLFDNLIVLKDAVVDYKYQLDQQNADIKFFNLPKTKAISKLYIQLDRNKKNYLDSFTKQNSYSGYLKLSSNIGSVEKDYYKNIDKHINFKVTIHYSKAKLNKDIDEKTLRLFIKDRDNNWRGPFRIFQNRTTHTASFKIRNYLIKPSKNITPYPQDVKTKNRPFAPTFYFGTLEEVTFVIAKKNALSNLTHSETRNEKNLIFE